VVDLLEHSRRGVDCFTFKDLRPTLLRDWTLTKLNWAWTHVCHL
jgi:hypothetical protein